MRVSFGMDIVCTKFPLIIKRISIESVVNAMIYGNVQTENKMITKLFLNFTFILILKLGNIIFIPMAAGIEFQ